MKRILMTIVAGLLVGLAGAADVTISSSETWTATEIGQHDAADTVTINPGVTLSFDVTGDVNLVVPFTLAGGGSVRIVGSGTATAKMGTIEFSGENTFTGGLVTESTATAANAIYVYGTAKTSFGKGSVTINDKSQIGLRMSELENDFYVNDAKGMICCVTAGCELKGDITATTALRLRPVKSFTISGKVTTPKTVGICNTGDDANGTITLAGKVTTKYLYGDHGEWYKKEAAAANYNHFRGHFILKAVDGGHDIDGLSAAGFGTINADGVNAFPEQAISGWGMEGSAYAGSGAFLNLAGSDQTIDRLQTYALSSASYAFGAQTPNNNGKDIVRSAAIGTTTATGNPLLTLKGRGNAWSLASIQDAISLDWAPTDDFTQVFSNRISTTTGSLTVSGGTLALGQLAQFTKAPSLTVKGGARFVVDTDQATDGSKVIALPALTSLSIADGGVFEYASGGAPFAEAQVAATIAAGGRIRVPEGMTLSLKTLTYDGKAVVPTTYSSAPWLTGGGTVAVAELIWTKADYDAYAATHDSIEIGTGSTLVFNYAAGEESTVGLRISGGGAVKFAGSGGKITVAGDNTFTGGATYAGATCVAVTSATGLGTGTITVSSTTAGVASTDSGVLHGLWFVGDYTLENPIVVTKENYLSFNASASTTSIKVNSPITADPATATVHLRVGVGSAEFFGEMTGGTFRKSGDNYAGTVVFRNVANIDSFYSTSGDWGRGTVRFAGTMNAATICNSIAGIETGAENPWSDETMLTFYPPGANYYQDDDKNYRLYHDAACDRIGLNGGALYFGKALYDGRFKKNATTEYQSPSVYSDSGKTLTMRGRGNGWTYATLKGSVNLVWDPIDDYTYTFSNRLHTTTGSIEVRRGTLVAGLGCEFSGVTRVVVRSGATLRLDSKLGDLYTRVFTTTGLKTLELEKGAKVEIAPGIAEAFGRVIYDGELQADDTYTDEPWLSGGGSVTVSAPQTVDFWKAAKSGLWGEAANWNLGAVPTSAQDVDVTVPGPSYTNTVAAAPAAIKSLVIGNSKPGETATVSFQTAYAPASGGLKATVEAGGVLDVSGANGSLVLAGQKAGDLVVRKGGRISLSGSGVFRVQNGEWGQVHVSGDGSLTATDNAVFSIGTPDAASSAARVGNLDMTFSGNAAFHGPDAKVGAGIFAASQSGVNQTNVWAFVDSATYGPRPAYFHNLGEVKDCVQILRLASEATHDLSDKMCVGEGFGTGILRIEKGSVRAGGYGVRIGSEYQRQTVTCVSRGILEMTGGTLDMSGAYDETWPNGLIVGSGWNVGYKDGVMKGGDFRGWIEMDGGSIVDSGAYSRLVIGVGLAEGVINQRGGSISKTTTNRAYATIVGWGGATGAWNLSGGSADIKGYLYVGGVTTNELGVCLKTGDAGAICVIGERTGSSVGTLDVAGGTFAVGKDLILSGDGQGTLRLGAAGKLAVAGNLDARAGSKLVVDVRGYKGRARTLATFGGTTTAFEDVEFLKDDGAEYTCKITDRMVRISSNTGAMLLVR